MNEEMICIIEKVHAYGLTYTIVEKLYEFGEHYVLLVNGERGFHSTDLKLVQKYIKSWM